MSSYIAKRWKILDKLGQGGFGTVYKARDLHNGDIDAVKVERGGRRFYSHLLIEYSVYHKVRDSKGFPRCYYFERERDRNVLVMQLLGPSLYKIRSRTSLSQKTVSMIAMQALERVETVHNASFLHRDITPLNLLIGKSRRDRIYLIDFGISKKYKEDSGHHIRFRHGKGVCGSKMFCSSNSDFGRELSRRDDLEGLGYTLLYLYHGRLPWRNIHSDSERGSIKIRSIERLCLGMFPCFASYFSYVRGLDFTEKPSYSYLRNLFRESLKVYGVHEDRDFEWL